VRHKSRWAGPVAWGLALSTGLAIAAPPVAGSERPAAAAARPISASVAAAIQATGTPSGVLATQEPVAAPAGQPFFKSSKGRVALVLLAAGTGYAIYSKFNDRVHSPSR
jgi:hypothetical protein